MRRTLTFYLHAPSLAWRPCRSVLSQIQDRVLWKVWTLDTQGVIEFLQPLNFNIFKKFQKWIFKLTFSFVPTALYKGFSARVGHLASELTLSKLCTRISKKLLLIALAPMRLTLFRLRFATRPWGTKQCLGKSAGIRNWDYLGATLFLLKSLRKPTCQFSSVHLQVR